MTHERRCSHVPRSGLMIHESLLFRFNSLKMASHTSTVGWLTVLAAWLCIGKGLTERIGEIKKYAKKRKKLPAPMGCVKLPVFGGERESPTFGRANWRPYYRRRLRLLKCASAAKELLRRGAAAEAAAAATLWKRTSWHVLGRRRTPAMNDPRRV